MSTQSDALRQHSIVYTQSELSVFSCYRAGNRTKQVETRPVDVWRRMVLERQASMVLLVDGLHLFGFLLAAKHYVFDTRNLLRSVTNRAEHMLLTWCPRITRTYILLLCRNYQNYSGRTFMRYPLRADLQ